jgi:hypothetical protein
MEQRRGGLPALIVCLEDVEKQLAAGRQRTQAEVTVCPLRSFAAA